MSNVLADPDLAFANIREESPWSTEHIKIAGKTCTVHRLTCYYGDEGTELKYSGTIGNPTPWTQSLLLIKQRVESITRVKYNFCAMSLYRDGSDYIGPHSDKEISLIKGMPIASISLGVSRDFIIRARGDAIRKGWIEPMDRLTFKLHHGDLLVMAGNMQKKYTHNVPKRANLDPINIRGYGVTNERINLTFRVTKIKEDL